MSLSFASESGEKYRVVYWKTPRENWQVGIENMYGALNLVRPNKTYFKTEEEASQFASNLVNGELINAGKIEKCQ